LILQIAQLLCGIAQLRLCRGGLNGLVQRRVGGELVRLTLDAVTLKQAKDEAAREDTEVADYVEKLERAYDQAAPLPTGDDIAAELEAFLREQPEAD